MPHWRVDYIGKKTSHLGSVEAPDEKAALSQAVKTFHITPARRFKLAVVNLEDRKGAK